MITLTIGNSTCKASGLTAKQFAELRKLTLYEERTGRWLRKKNRAGKLISIPEVLTHYLMDKRAQFPTGLLYIVEDYLNSKGAKFLYQDTRIKPELSHSGFAGVTLNRKFEPYPEQRAAAGAALEHGRGIVVGPTGVGKSAIAAEIIDAFRVPTLIVVPSLELKRQLTEGLSEVFGADVVGPMRKGNLQRLITVENVDALDPNKQLLGVDCVIIDEFHHSGAKTYRVLNRKAWSGVYYKIGLTATPFRSRDAERLLLESVLSHVIYRIEYELAVAKGYIVPMEVYYYELPEVKLKCAGTNFHSVYKELVVEREDRNELIASLGDKLSQAEKSTLILTKQVLHGEILQDLMDKRGTWPAFVKGENDDNKEVIAAFNRQDFPVLIGTTGVVGEGVDTKPCEYVILAGGGKSKNQFMQNCGRGFRRFGDKESCKIILFRDPSHKWLAEHFDTCVKYLKEEYGVIPTKLEI